MSYSSDPKGEAAHHTGDIYSAPDDQQPSFLATARKAVAGGIASGVTGASAAVGLAVANDGVIDTQEWWVILFATFAGFLAGAAIVYRVPNASR